MNNSILSEAPRSSWPALKAAISAFRSTVVLGVVAQEGKSPVLGRKALLDASKDSGDEAPRRPGAD